MGAAPIFPLSLGPMSQELVLADRYEVRGAVEGEPHVFRGTDRHGGTPVTIRGSWKVEHDPGALARWQTLADPHVARVLAAGEYRGASYFVTELLDGYSLSDELRFGPLSLGRMLATGARVCDAVAALHEHDLVHGQLSMSTVYVGWPSGPHDNDVSGVKLVPPATALAPSPEAIAADVEACRSLLVTLLERDATAPPALLAQLADATTMTTMTTARQLGQRCRGVLHELSGEQRCAVGTRQPPPPMPEYRGPMPTNWTPPPRPRDFAYKRRPG